MTDDIPKFFKQKVQLGKDTTKYLELTPEEIQKMIDDGSITVQAQDKGLKIISSWKIGVKKFWIVQISEKDFSLFDGMGVLDVTWTSEALANESMRVSGATRVFNVRK